MIPHARRDAAALFPLVTLSLILANCLILLFTPSRGPRVTAFVYRFGLIPYEAAHCREVVFVRRVPEWDAEEGGMRMAARVSERRFQGCLAALFGAYLPVLTSMFVHANVFHLALNVFFLWLFGNLVENYLGHARFLWFYLLCGLIASLVHVLAATGSRVPVIGASGAVSGLLGACLLIDPTAPLIRPLPFLYFVRIGAVPAFALVALWFGILVMYSTAVGSLAWAPHIGGFIAGAGLVFLFKPRRGYTGDEPQMRRRPV